MMSTAVTSSPTKPKRSSNITLGNSRDAVSLTALTPVATPPPTPPTPTAFAPATVSGSSTPIPTPPSSTVLAVPLPLPSATITLEGYLSKQAEKGLVKGWKRRWFSANDLDFKMFYYKPSFGTSNYDQVAGHIDLTAAQEVKASSGNKLGFDIVTATRKWCLVASSEEILNYWVTGLTQILAKRAGQGQKPPSDIVAPTSTSLSSTPTPTPPPSLLGTLVPPASSSNPSPPSGSKHSSAEVKLTESTEALRMTPKRATTQVQLVPGAFLEGYLEKQGANGLVKAWKKRYFVAKGSKLWYYKQSMSGYDQRAGFIDLTAVTKVEQGSGKDKLQFQIHSQSRTWYLAAATEEDVQYWLSGLPTLLASIAQQPTSTETVKSTIVMRSTSDTTYSRSAMGMRQDSDMQRMIQRLTEMDRMISEKDKCIEQLKEKCVKMEDKMILWNRIAFLNWAEATELDKRLADAEKARETSVDDEPYLKQIRLLKKQLNEKAFNCQILEVEVEKLNAELRSLKAQQPTQPTPPSCPSRSSTGSTDSNASSVSSVGTTSRPVSEVATPTLASSTRSSGNLSAPNLLA